MVYPQYPYNTTQYEYNEEYVKRAKIAEEKSKLKKSANSVGVLLLISSIIFLFASTIFVIAYEVIGMNFTLPAGLDSIPDNIITGLSNAGVFGVVSLVYLKITKSDISETFVFKKVSAKKLCCLVAVGFTVSMISNLLTNLFLSNAYYFGIDLMFEIDTPVSNSPLEIAVYLISTACVPAISEEILFRGVILSKLRSFSYATAVFVSALLFGLFHGNFIQFPFAFIIGLVLGFTVVYTNSMLPAILIHFCNNAFSVISDVLYTNAEAIAISEKLLDIFTYGFIVLIAIVSLIGIYYLAKRDKNLFDTKKYSGELSRKEKNRIITLSPAIIAATILLFAESVFTHYTMSQV